MQDKNVVQVNYHQTGKSTNTNELGMREMQARVYQHRKSKYILVKAPPASGKSRALMFVALDKLANQGIKKVIVAVPERSIGRSFKDTELVKYGFYEDWKVDPQYDLTLNGGQESKVKKLIDFLKSSDGRILVCTHATLRFAYQEVADDHQFDDVMIAIDEFHHVSSDDSSVLGDALRNIVHNSSAHVLAMTGSYFRGDSAPILSPEDEQKFDKVTYTYYEQLDGYQYLKSFGIDYKFYQGRYTNALDEALDTTKKTIIHIPSVNSSESTKDKYDEVDRIFDTIGDIYHQDEETGIYYIKDKHTGRMLKVADLVNEDGREKVGEYLRDKLTGPDDLDIIVALNMAKEGFDWPWAEQALTIGYRRSLTEIVQIIGRVTRDSSNKTHAQFTNMIEQPDAKDGDVEYAVNQILKAITASLLMEQVLAPEIHLKRRKHKNDKPQGDTDILIKGLKEPTTKRVESIIENDLPDLKAAILQDDAVQKGIAANVDANVMNKELVPKVVMTRYPDLNDDEVEQVSQYAVADTVLRHAQVETINKDGNKNEILRMADKFINVDRLDINLIESINPFQRAYDVMSQNIDSDTLRLIERSIDARKYDFSDDELIQLYNNAKKFVAEKGRRPQKNSSDEEEVRMAYALAKLADMRVRRSQSNE
ncbi:DEAD/DEAH box helicase [Limosilactobacillus difficilis]|uniref:DEAD/DEAH box helicase n=1 Tax=Limosilactobacillus difficilis TaxID=2991838 RepID=UPI0024BBA3FC|nr:DEAD/DEAH box helicase [Limosilactobacillus difficilis]